MKLLSNRYGKARVRVMKILRHGPKHTVMEIEATVLLEGDFAGSYIAGDNSQVVPTDTIKNTVNILAKEHLREEIERFGTALGEHFLSRYSQVQKVDVEITAKSWQRLEVNGEPHPHSFVAGGSARSWTRVRCTRDEQAIHSGIRDLVILKSTGSGWAGYPKCDYTTLPETNDRILATSFDATWKWSSAPQNFAPANESILAAMLAVFADNYSTSAQASVYQMGAAALENCAAISRIDLVMPNKHCLLINLAPFGLQNENEVFLPIDEPQGQIEASVTRDD